jgi:hypothetical protein
MLNNTSISVSHASATLGPSIPSNGRKLCLEKPQIEQCPGCSIGCDIRAIALAKCLVVSVIN